MENTPIPDPTILTTQQLEKGLSAERDYVDGKIAILKEHLRGIDEATRVLSESLNRTPTQIEQSFSRLEALISERFKSVAVQFAEREIRSERESRDNKVAVEAAFAAQKEASAEQNKSSTLAIGKSERATSETLAKQADLFKSTTDALLLQITDLKERVARGESVKIGSTETKGSVYAMVGLGISILFLIIGIVSFLSSIQAR